MSSNQALPSANLEQATCALGEQIFARLSNEQHHSQLSKNYWITKIMAWSMQKPDYKTQLFRLVDVLPSLQTSASVAEHVAEYLGPVASDIHPVFGWALQSPAKSLRAKALAKLVKKGVEETAGLFIAGSGPQQALKKMQALRKNKLAFTIDLLGEYCVSENEALRYLDRYLEALDVLGTGFSGEADQIVSGHRAENSALCVSVKLSALYSQCNPLNFNRSVNVIADRLDQIVSSAKNYNAQVYVDAEDMANNPIIYSVFKKVFADPAKALLPGIVLQAYAKGAEERLKDLLAFSKKRGAPIAIRLVKGAYWDYETVISQQQQLESPLFKHKVSSDYNFEKLARTMIENRHLCLPAFASHNIRSLAFACSYAKERGLSQRDFELQMLYGMAEPIAKVFSDLGYLVRLYVPLGDLFVGMGYLVRRLLENTSNESFLRHTFFDKDSIESLLAKPELHAEDQ